MLSQDHQDHLSVCSEFDSDAEDGVVKILPVVFIIKGGLNEKITLPETNSKFAPENGWQM